MQVAQAIPHKLYRGDRVIIKTYKLGNTTIHIANDLVCEAKLEQIDQDIADANYAIWDSLSEEEQLEVIQECAREEELI